MMQDQRKNQTHLTLYRMTIMSKTAYKRQKNYKRRTQK